MSDTRSQLAEIDSLIALSPDDPSLKTLREDLLQLIALEQIPSVPNTTLPSFSSSSEMLPTDFSASDSVECAAHEPQLTTLKSLMEAPDLEPFQPVKASTERNNLSGEPSNQKINPTEQLEKKKKKKPTEQIDSKFEIPSHLIPLDSDTPAQKLKKQRAAKALKSKFREKQKEMEANKKQNDWKSFAKAGKTKSICVASSIFSTEEGVNARVGVVSGGGSRKMTDFSDKGGNKRHKFI